MAGPRLVTDQVLAGESKAGLARLSCAPGDASAPVALGANDPSLMRMFMEDGTGKHRIPIVALVSSGGRQSLRLMRFF